MSKLCQENKYQQQIRSLNSGYLMWLGGWVLSELWETDSAQVGAATESAFR